MQDPGADGLLTQVSTSSLQATIMSDPGMADRTYIGPMTPEYAEQILAKVSEEHSVPTARHSSVPVCPCMNAVCTCQSASQC